MANENLLSGRAKSLLNDVREFFTGAGYGFRVTSTGRTAKYNATIAGASSSSQHILRGGVSDAFDFQVLKDGKIVDPLAVQATLAVNGFTYGQSIAEYGRKMNPRNHLGVGSSGQTLLTTGGAYKPVSVDKSKSLTKAVLNGGAGAGREWMRKNLPFGLGDAASDLAEGVGNAMQAPGNYVDEALGGWVMRGAIAIVAILLLGAAIFSLSKGSLPSPLKLAS